MPGMNLLRSRKKVSNKAFVVAAITGAVLVAAALLFAMFMSSGIKGDQYQLVKLTTGEIFFGKLQGTQGEYLTLENAYFIQDAENMSDTTILSRKNTVAKSESPMRIKSDKVVYWENLAKDSKIAETIKNAAGN
jgi:hypothetical protein